jgi:hypothetical protein
LIFVSHGRAHRVCCDGYAVRVAHVRPGWSRFASRRSPKVGMPRA